MAKIITVEKEVEFYFNEYKEEMGVSIDYPEYIRIVIHKKWWWVTGEQLVEIMGQQKVVEAFTLPPKKP